MKAPVNIKIKLLQHVLDFPLIGKILKQPAAGAISHVRFAKYKGVTVFV